MAIRVALHHKTEYRYDRPGDAAAARRPAAAGAALPHADPQLLAAGRAGAALPQLAAGPVRQLPGAARLSRADARASRRGRSGRRDDGRSTRSTSSSSQTPRTFPVRLRRRCWRDELAPFLRDASRPARSCTRWLASIAARRRAHDRLPGRAQPAAAAARSATSIRMEPGVQTLRGDADARAAARAATRPGCWCRSLRHLGLAARFVSGYLIQLDGRREAARRARRARAATSPTCTPGPRCICPARAGSASIRPRACSPAKGTSRWPAPPTRPAPRRSPARTRRPTRRRRRVSRRVRHRDDASRAFTKTRASPSPTPTSSGRRSTRSGDAVDAQLAAGDVRLTMGGEPTFVSIDDMDGASGTSPRSGADKRQLAGELLDRLRDALRAGRPAALRPGQVVSRASRCRAGRSAATGARDGEPIWRRPGADRRRRRATTAYGAERRAALRRRRWPSGSASIPSYVMPGLRRRLVLPLAASAGCRSTSIRSTASSTMPKSARGWRASSSRGSDSVVGYVLPLRARGGDGRAALAERPVDPAAGAPVPDARRFADGLSPAARLAALGAARRSRR